MKKGVLPMKNWIRIILLLCGAMLVAILYVPIWRIDLDAPQYPEGLNLLIYANKIGGNVDIINGLNHYIGMKTIHAEDFIEFKALPYIIGFFAAFFLLVAIVRNRKLMNALFISFLSFGVIAMVDFWKWEYDYGHNLNPDAAIIVPGMAYQPPLIGFKQLLNFGAYSVPDKGGWLFVAAGVLLLLCVVVDFRTKRAVGKVKAHSHGIKPHHAVATLILVFLLPGCSATVEPISVGSDNCNFCKMTISDVRFGVEVITKKGKIYKYDEGHCFFSSQKEGELKQADIKEIYFTDYCGKHELVKVEKEKFLKSEELKSPMGGNIAAFSNIDSLKKYAELLHGEEISWSKMGNE